MLCQMRQVSHLFESTMIFIVRLLPAPNHDCSTLITVGRESLFCVSAEDGCWGLRKWTKANDTRRESAHYITVKAQTECYLLINNSQFIINIFEFMEACAGQLISEKSEECWQQEIENPKMFVQTGTFVCGNVHCQLVKNVITTKIMIQDGDDQRITGCCRCKSRWRRERGWTIFYVQFWATLNSDTRVCSLDEPFSLFAAASSHVTHSQSCIVLHNNSVYFCIITLPRNKFLQTIYICSVREFWDIGYRFGFSASDQWLIIITECFIIMHGLFNGIQKRPHILMRKYLSLPYMADNAVNVIHKELGKYEDKVKIFGTVSHFYSCPSPMKQLPINAYPQSHNSCKKCHAERQTHLLLLPHPLPLMNV